MCINACSHVVAKQPSKCILDHFIDGLECEILSPLRGSMEILMHFPWVPRGCSSPTAQICSRSRAWAKIKI